ncbi:hypothetical protein LIER_12327 [Lithospermum erythrorhizon]|uniref:Uncharacterized protein n=1 Tax=Lithospermum erythrorhizon TaxID=34254 RepID=A0AAV3PVQ0_LITER
MLKRFGVPAEGLELKIESRGVAPNGGGEVVLSVPVVQDCLEVGPYPDPARGIFNRLPPDIHIFTGHKAGAL